MINLRTVPLMIITAIEYATRAHRDQVRKSDNLPYIAHPVAVQAIVAAFGGDEFAQVGALLHDVVEDTPVTLKEIQRDFGILVAKVVREVTEQGTEGTGPKPSWETRKQASIDAIGHKSYRALLVTAADKLHNVMGLVAQYEVQGEALWDKFSRGKEKQLWVYGTLARKIQAVSRKHTNPGLTKLADRLVAEVAKLEG